MVRTLGIAMIVLGMACAGLLAGAESPATPSATGPSTQPAKELKLDLGEGVSLKLVLIPAGKFMMGSPAGEKDRANDETQHEATLTKGFYLGVTEVTQEQYEAVMGNNPSNFKGAKNPVEQVSWHDATEFCRKVSEKSGKKVRLPTEAEWEYACRAGTQTPFNTGETISTEQANYDGNSTYGNGRKGEYRKKTVPVGSFQSNAWGLYDMHGNVWEWCQDAYQADISAQSGDPWIKGNTNTVHVLRGGSWTDDPQDCRSANRFRYVPDARSYNDGFRVALDSELTGAEPPPNPPAAQPSTQPARELKLDLGQGVSLKLVQIPAGTFLMGSPKDEKGRQDNEGVAVDNRANGHPQVQVIISKPFYMGIYEVTVEQYEQFVEDTGTELKASGGRPDHPVIAVSWDNAQAFCQWLSKKSGRKVVLPTEAQWEYACRAGTKTRFSFGDDDKDLGDYAWYLDNSRVKRVSALHPVGQKKPNAWGLYDMHGNVSEWCADFYADHYAGTGVDPAATQPALSEDQIKALIARLGDPDVSVREAVGHELFKAGLTALPALRQAAKSDDVQFAASCEALLARIEESATGPEHGDFRRVSRGGSMTSGGATCRSAYRMWNNVPSGSFADLGFRVAVDSE